jgi:hypothetical protein
MSRITTPGWVHQPAGQARVGGEPSCRTSLTPDPAASPDADERKAVAPNPAVALTVASASGDQG